MNRRLALAATLSLTLCAALCLGPSAFAADENLDEDLHNTVKWTTASETDNFGYNVYRADREEGPFERLNEEPIPGAGTTDETTRYQWVDDTIDPHRAYFYYVESISLGGDRARFTPIIMAPPKLPDDENGPPAGDDGEKEPPAGGEKETSE